MINKNNAFSLIEVIIATAIISVTVFGVYKLIGENNKIINNSGNYLQLKSLFPVLEECINYINSDFSKQSGSYNIYLGNSLNSCNTTGTGNIIDNIDYSLTALVTATGSNYINWELSISSEEVRTQTGFYRQIKK